MSVIFSFFLNQYVIFFFIIILSFAGVGEIHTLINKYFMIGIVVIYALLSNYNKNMLKKEISQKPTASFYRRGYSIMIEYILIVLIYCGIIYISLKII